MSGNRRPQGSIQPLSVGNVVSTGVRLYRSHFKSYLGLSAKAYLWILVPIYGWAKYSAISAMISRLAFAELIAQPESVEMAQDKVNSRMWSFLSLGLQISILLFLIYLGLTIVGVIISGIISVILATVFGQTASSIITIVIMSLLVIGILAGILWFYAHWMIAEVPLAVEDNLNATESRVRSWSLSKKSVWRIQAIVLIAFVVSLPILAITNYLPSIFLIGVEPGSSLYWIIYSISIIISLIGGAIIMPFWQTIKAAIYYDLRSRREGLGLKLRDHKI